MDPIEIQYRLRKKGVTQASIAEEEAVSEMLVSLVIHKKRFSENGNGEKRVTETVDRVMKNIAGKIEKPHQQVFPEFYEDDENIKQCA